MQIGEEDLVLSQLGPFGSLGLFDLHDHIGAGENLGSGVGDDRSGLAIGLIGRSDACACVGLDEDAVTGTPTRIVEAPCFETRFLGQIPV
jgi:hypothetical protein